MGKNTNAKVTYFKDLFIKTRIVHIFEDITAFCGVNLVRRMSHSQKCYIWDKYVTIESFCCFALERYEN